MLETITFIFENISFSSISSILFKIFWLWVTYYIIHTIALPDPNLQIQSNRDGLSNIRKRFSSKHVENRYYDVIIVGSGMSGLSTAALLSIYGKKVLVLEQHYEAGGCMHMFEDKGYLFDTGLHYIGDFEDMNNLLNVVTGNKLMMNDIKIYDEIGVNGLVVHKFRTGKENWIHDFATGCDISFRKAKSILEIMKIAAYSLRVTFLIKMLPNFIAKPFWKFLSFMNCNPCIDNAIKLSDYFKHNDPIVFKVLSGIAGDHGEDPNTVSMAIHGAVMNHYVNKACYPKGGGRSIAKACCETIRKNRGEILVNANVSEILIENNKAIGVLVNNKVVNGKIIVSSTGIYNTISLVKNPTLLPTLKNILPKLKQSVSHAFLFVGFDIPGSEIGLRDSNIWHFPNDDICNLKQDMHDINKFLDNDWCAFISSPSTKDREDDKASCIIITEAPYKLFEQYKYERTGHRSDEYQQMKTTIQDKLLEILYLYYPKAKDHISFCECATPVSTEYYLNSVEGSSYGLAMTPERYSDFDIIRALRPDTDVKNLYLTGQDISTNGIAGAIGSAYLTAHKILGFNCVDLLSEIMIKKLKN